MTWNEVGVPSGQATDKQKEYAKKLMVDCYGDIVENVDKMTKRELSEYIDTMLKLQSELDGIEHRKLYGTKSTIRRR